MKIPKLDKYQTNKITQNELKAIMLTYYYPFLKKQAKINSEIWVQNFKRKLHITKIRNCYNKIGTIVFSIDGSPPKSHGIFILDEAIIQEENFKGNLIIIGNNRTSLTYHIQIKDKKNN